MGSDGGDKEGPGRSACRSSTPRPLQFVNLTVPAARRQRWHDHRGRRPIPGRAKARSPRGAGPLTGLSEAQCRALALADNRIALPVVRRLVGYGRFDGGETARVMARLYAAARLLVNFFQPSFKLKAKRREVRPRRHQPLSRACSACRLATTLLRFSWSGSRPCANCLTSSRVPSTTKTPQS